MVVIGTSLASGPKRRSPTEKAVHLLLLSAESSGRAGGPAQPATIGLAEAAKHVGLPKPTDVVVLDRKPFHFAAGALHPHPQVHVDFPETILQLSISNGDTAVWWSEDNFEIKSIRLTHGHDAGAAGGAGGGAPYPFAAPPVTAVEEDLTGRSIFVARSGVPVIGAMNHTYKISFTMDGNPQLIDPDMSCNP